MNIGKNQRAILERYAQYHRKGFGVEIVVFEFGAVAPLWDVVIRLTGRHISDEEELGTNYMSQVQADRRADDFRREFERLIAQDGEE